MEQSKKVSFLAAAIAIMGVLLLAGLHGVAEDNPLHEEYQAQARGEGTQLAQTFNVTVHIEEYSTPEERQILVDAFNKGSSHGLFNALNKTKAKGRIAITGTLGYDINFVRKLPTATGSRIRIVTDRPITFGESWTDSTSMDYNLSFLELDLDKATGKGTGTLVPAGQLKIDPKTNELTVEAYQNPWQIVDVQDRTKK